MPKTGRTSHNREKPVSQRYPYCYRGPFKDTRGINSHVPKSSSCRRARDYKALSNEQDTSSPQPNTAQALSPEYDEEFAAADDFMAPEFSQIGSNPRPDLESGDMISAAAGSDLDGEDAGPVNPQDGNFIIKKVPGAARHMALTTRVGRHLSPSKMPHIHIILGARKKNLGLWNGYLCVEYRRIRLTNSSACLGYVL